MSALLCDRCHKGIWDYEDSRDHDDCLYESCDVEDCRALKDPRANIEELKIAIDHWKKHGYLGGCSHGR